MTEYQERHATVHYLLFEVARALADALRHGQQVTSDIACGHRVLPALSGDDAIRKQPDGSCEIRISVGPRAAGV